MVHPNLGNGPQAPYYGGPPPVAPKEGFGKLTVVLFMATGVIAGCTTGYGNAVGDASLSSPPATVTQTQWGAIPSYMNAAPSKAPVLTEEQPTPLGDYVPKTSDFKIEVKVTEKQCFGSAGCIVTYHVQPSYSGKPLSEDQQFDVTYKLTGGNDPAVGTVTISGDRWDWHSENTIQTPLSGSVLTAKVTDLQISSDPS